MSSALHTPVLVDEVRTLLQPERGGIFVDGTVGLGGHARMLLDAGATRLVGIDRDLAALALAAEATAGRATLVHGDYRAIDTVLDQLGITEVNGVLLDLGVSSMQLDEEGRGFSFRRDEPLDMRMDRSSGETAADKLLDVDEEVLADLIYRFGEERKSRRVARAIVQARQAGPIETTGQLAAIVRRAAGGHGWQRIDPATRTFQALRIWVNGELDGLDACLGRIAARLQPGGRMAVIAFHSLEDRVVKHTLRSLAKGDTASMQILTKRPVTATDQEVAGNPRARSAKLRAAVRGIEEERDGEI